jgi:hypothetical protein
MDGIGGLIIGNMFKIPLDVLPKGYKNAGGVGAKLGYVVTGLSHTIQGNDWITKVTAQTIILSDPQGEDLSFTDLTLSEGTGQADGASSDAGGGVEINVGTGQTPPTITLSSSPRSAGSGGYSSSPVATYYKNKGYSNGTIPNNELVNLRTDDNTSNRLHRLHPKAAAQWEGLVRAARAAGFNISKFNVSHLTAAAYRPLGEQKSGPGRAAPGSSPHGWGGALDIQQLYTLQGGRKNLGPAAHKKVRDTSALWQWLEANGPTYGWYNPSRMRNGPGAESWHYEYWGPV